MPAVLFTHAIDDPTWTEKVALPLILWLVLAAQLAVLVTYGR